MKSTILALLFSRDRQLQLDATLRSLRRHCNDSDCADIKVLFKASQEHRTLYLQLSQDHLDVEWVPEGDLRAQLLSLLSGYQFVLFLVDDNIVVHPFSLAELARILAEESQVLGASLRLGRNTTYCYPCRALQRLPLMSQWGSFQRFRWVQAEYDFGYPLEISSSLYRTGDIQALLSSMPFGTPNELEAGMAGQALEFADTRPDLICFDRSVAFSNPINIVQTLFPENRVGQSAEYSTNHLAKQFAEGNRICIECYDGLTANACHQEVALVLERLS